MVRFSPTGCLLFSLVMMSAAPGAVSPIPGDVLPREYERLPVAAATASSEYAAAEGGYAPLKACDGNRRSKWVACQEPSEQSPQWIRLELAGGPQVVAAVAVCCEAVNNDGIIDAQIQVAGPDNASTFHTVETVKGATTANWLATFPPEKTMAVRLLITRSGGPSPNTDVYEIEILGKAPNPEELKKRAEERAAKAQSALAASTQAARNDAKAVGAGTKVVSRRDGSRLQVMNDQVVLTLNEADGKWSAAWIGKAPALAQGIGFSVEAGKTTLRPAGASASVKPCTDALGSGLEISQAWGDAVHIERSLRVYDGRPSVAVFGRIINNGPRDTSLGTARVVDLSEAAGGSWHLGALSKAPAAVWIGGIGELLCRPAGAAGASTSTTQVYAGTGVLALAGREPCGGLVLGYLTAFEARPDLSAAWRAADGGTSLGADLRFLGRKLGPGESVTLDPAYLSVHDDPYIALERYGDAAALFAPQPVRHGPMSIWCSWYAHRMAMTEDLVLANAAVAAKHFKPLGMNIMQLDHGWQRGDITGDWEPNERFPHGLKWLADELKSRYGMRLGVWIAPTDVAATSDLFQKHPDWMLKDEQGKPRVNWKWYWKPNPDCYELDASNPAAARWIEDTFARLTAAGVSYYKIDFIAASSGEHFHQHDPKATRGWSVLARAMEAIRRGAGPKAQIRYCQTPPLLSMGLADAAYEGVDTLDAGVPGRFDVLQTNARSLAAGYWINDRLYHREVCDMSVRMQAELEEVRVRLAMMTLAGCSISFSDEFQFLPPSRIRMMQQCLPPGCPPMKPLDLFDRDNPSLWHVRCRNGADEWDVVGVFNFESRPAERSVDFNEIGLPPNTDALVFEFWEERFLGVHRNSLTLTLPPQSSRILAIRRAADHPQLVGTDMHVLQGYHELKALSWNAATGTLAGEFERMPGLACKAFIYVPEGWQPRFDFPLSEASARLTHVSGRLWAREIVFDSARCAWSIPFDRGK